MPRRALNFYVKFTPRNFKGSGSARRARTIFESASLALQNFISAFKFYPRYPRNFASILKFAPKKSTSVFKFSLHRLVLNLCSALRAVFAAAGALSAKILSLRNSTPQSAAQNFCKNSQINFAEVKILRKNHAFKFNAPFATKNPAVRNFALLNSAPLNLTLRNSARQNSNPQSFARQSLGQQGRAQQSALARRNLAPKKSARLNRASKIAAAQNFMRLNLAMPQSPLLLNSAFKFKASADV